MRYENIQKELKSNPKRWLVTGAAGFIGSHLVEKLLQLGQKVTGLDNFSTGKQSNLDAIRSNIGEDLYSQFTFIEGDITNLDICKKAVQNTDHILHQAALGSVPLSIEFPVKTHDSNVTGFLNILEASRLSNKQNVVYASSSAVYGDEPSDKKTESLTGKMISPYAFSKHMDELYAECHNTSFGIQTTGLRYFNVFGPRQDPNGAYAAVIPKWIYQMVKKDPVKIFGDGSTTRDFCHVANVVQANILAATTPSDTPSVYNVGLEAKTDLNTLFHTIRDAIGESQADVKTLEPIYESFRDGDILHSQASIKKIQAALSYEPTVSLAAGLKETVNWFLNQ